MCLFSIGGLTVEPTVFKFGMEDHVYPREIKGYISFWYPYPQRWGRPKSCSGGPCSPNSAFLRNFYKKVDGHPLKIGGRVRSNQVPDLIQVSGSRSKYMVGFSRPSPV